MPLLNRAGTIIEATTISNAAVDAGGTPLIPLADWHPAGGAGLLLEVDDEPQLRFAVAPLIAINFPSFNDGRGLSLAVLLRTRVGFEGELRAVGDVHPDLVHYLRRCGFDTFQLPDERTWPAGHTTLAPHDDYYQASVLEPQPAYRRIARGT